MKSHRIVAAGALVAVGAMVLSGCSAPNRDPEIVGGSSITVAWNDPFFAYNSNLSETNAAANANIIHLANNGFVSYDPTPALVHNDKFGTVEKVSENPLKVKYTIGEGVTWSDGTPVDAADIILSWASGTTHRTEGDVPEPEYDDEGNVTNQAAIDAAAEKGVFWGTSAVKDRQLDLVQEMPEVGDDGRSVTMTYSKPWADWETFGDADDLNISAHGTVQLAFPEITDAQQAKDKLIEAVKNNDAEVLGKIATAFRTDYVYKSTPTKPQQTLSNGPYVITELVQDQYVTLKAREDYTWGTKPKYETITVRFIADPQAQVQALQNGEVQIVQSQPTADLLQQLEGTSGIKWESSKEGTYEHVDLQATNGGVFDPASYGGDAEKAKKIRKAFLLTIPRDEIVEKLIKPLEPNATTRDSNLLLPGAAGYDESVKTSGIADLKTNIEEAKKLLAEAGVTNPEVRFLTAQDNPRRQSELQLITASAEQAGFKIVDASTKEWSEIVSSQPNAYDAALFGWASTSTGVGEFGANYVTGGNNNYYGWSNTRMDEIVKEVDVTTDAAQQQKLTIEAESIIYDEAWSIPIFQHPGVVAWSEKVENVKPGFLAPQYFWNATEWAPAGGTK
ncbi:ABC transporter family substrate-binding protein [Pseudoclavibacter alba]|uniref:ABC transporter family substrate-binding protein n=1 Tax=Pseudoclavibacter albus TaxID=272241 RepID=A0ABT2HW69_9MICO|nr:ABC transporter family substrate-binding protein [Pseudoclavibacter alba]MBN6777619.1 ABC transporter family substrate-binding protein [Pseudoclavibacter alba]MCT2042568.1 ABC transporter family substrate-binding protein [Pseudoclavibacter alba]